MCDFHWFIKDNMTWYKNVLCFLRIWMMNKIRQRSHFLWQLHDVTQWKIVFQMWCHVCIAFFHNLQLSQCRCNFCDKVIRSPYPRQNHGSLLVYAQNLHHFLLVIVWVLTVIVCAPRLHKMSPFCLYLKALCSTLWITWGKHVLFRVSCLILT